MKLESMQEIKQIGEKYLMQTYDRLDVVFQRGAGAKLYDISGKEYIDFGSGIGVNSVGYGHPRFVDTIASQAQTLIHTSNLYHIPTQALLAQKLASLADYEGVAFFANSGAEANECMIKLARKFGEVKFSKKRYKIITLQSSFHGRTLATLKATGQEAFHRFFAPFPDGFIIAKDLQEIYDLIDDETCAVMIELIQGEGGVRALPKDEVRKLELFLQKKEVLLLVDEIQSGAYRSGEFLASQVYGIAPDAISLAKGIGGGMPIGVVISKHRDVLLAGDHGSTFGGNPLSTRASLEVLEILKEERESGRLEERIKVFNTKLDELVGSCNCFVRKSGLGLMLGLEMAESDRTEKGGGRLYATPMEFVARALEEGVILLRSGKNIVRFLPPLTISKEEIAEGFERLRKIC